MAYYENLPIYQKGLSHDSNTASNKIRLKIEILEYVCEYVKRLEHLEI